MRSEGKTILITGSTDGVGRRVALALAVEGAKVLVHGRDRERGESLLDEMRRVGNEAAAFYPADLSSLAEVRRLAAAIPRDHDRLVTRATAHVCGRARPRPRGRRVEPGFCLTLVWSSFVWFVRALQLPRLWTRIPLARLDIGASAAQRGGSLFG